MFEPWNADSITLGNWEPMLTVRKKSLIVHATQLNFPEGFVVTTLEGIMKGKSGDYLMIGIVGEKYPVDQQIFEDSYDIVEETDGTKI